MRMSANDNRYEELKEEVRSEENSIAGSSEEDFIASETSAPELEMEPGQRPEDLDEEDTNEGRSVSIFDTSGRGQGDQDLGVQGMIGKDKRGKTYKS